MDRLITSSTRQPATETTGEPTPVAPAEPAPTDRTQAAERYKVDWGENGKEGYDPALVKNVEGLANENSQLHDRLEKFDAFMAAEDQRQQVQAEYLANEEAIGFHQAVDALDSERYGKTYEESGKLAPQISVEHQALREKLWEQVDELRAGLQAYGRPVPNESELLNRAQAAIFPDHIKRKAVATQNSKLRNQSGRRLGTGAGGRPRRDETIPEDIMDDKENEADFEKCLQVSIDNGA